MEENKKLYIKMVQKEMNEVFESGTLNPEQQYSFIEKICQKLVLVDIDNITVNIKRFFNDLELLEKDFKKHYKQYIDKKADMCKEIYEEIKKL